MFLGYWHGVLKLRATTVAQHLEFMASSGQNLRISIPPAHLELVDSSIWVDLWHHRLLKLGQSLQLCEQVETYDSLTRL